MRWLLFSPFPLDIANLIEIDHFSYLDHNFYGKIGAISLQGKAGEDDKSIRVHFIRANYDQYTVYS